ncbi:MAG: flagellar hook protein FlgE [Bdellovibrionales bacterium]|nr:flagellar hook protein FlgE [Bdellovibrionales bacterium]
MGILSSLYTGITGLQANGEALSIYGDNLANANTTGFKTSRPEFQDVVAKSLKGLLGGNQIGRGTRLAAVNPIYTQGSITQTESSTDLSITGDGFFVLQGIDGKSFSRNGAFHFDKDGKLINADGYHVMGFRADADGNITSKMDTISVDKTVIDAKKTTAANLFMNLDLRADPKMQFDPAKPERTSHFATGVNIYDTAGTPHVVTLYFNKQEDGSWVWRAMAKGEEIEGGEPGTLIEQAVGKLDFDTDGRLREQSTDRSEFNFIGALPNQNIEFKFGTDKATGGTGTEVTQYGTDSEAYKTLQDGYTAGTLAGLTFNDDGSLAAIYTNGETANLAQVALAKFENPEGLFKSGQNRFKESRLSGQPTVGAPQTGGRGQISAKTLESSTTDIANEFINLMGAQRNFQANSRVIQVADQMMQEVLNIGRG